VTWPAPPLGSDPIAGPSSLLRAGPPLRLASVLSPPWPWPPGLLPLGDQGADSTTRPHVSKQQILLFRARACNELTPPLHRTPPGPRAGSSLAPSTPEGRPLFPGQITGPGFDVVTVSFDASAVVQPCSSSRRSPDPLFAGLLRSRFPPRLLTDMTLRWFGISACTANPEGLPPSLAQHGSWGAIFYIVTTPLSGRTILLRRTAGRARTPFQSPGVATPTSRGGEAWHLCPNQLTDCADGCPSRGRHLRALSSLLRSTTPRG
jgi:hypothetical protein